MSHLCTAHCIHLLVVLVTVCVPYELAKGCFDNGPELQTTFASLNEAGEELVCMCVV